MLRKKIKLAQLPGGLADKAHKTFKDFPKSKLNRGQKVEREHTKSDLLARTIALDHLVEDPQYYEKLQKLEKRSHIFRLSKLAKVGGKPPPLPRRGNIPNISQAERDALVQKLREDRQREALGLGASRAPVPQVVNAPAVRTSVRDLPEISFANTNPPLTRQDALGSSRAAVEKSQRRAAASPVNQEINQLRAKERRQALEQKLKQRAEQRAQQERTLDAQRLNAQRPGAPYPQPLNAQIQQDPGTLAALRADRLNRAQRRAETRTTQGQRPHGSPVSAAPRPGAAAQPAVQPAPAVAAPTPAAQTPTPAPTTAPPPAAGTPKPKKPKAAPSGGINPLVAGAGLLAAGAGLHSMMSSPEPQQGGYKYSSARGVSAASLRAFVEEFDKIAKELTTAGRSHIKTKNFAIPETSKYPIHDARHARNALARVSQHGTPDEKVRVRAAVAKKWPGLVGEETKKDLRSGGISKDEPAAGTVLTEKLKHSAAMCGAARRVGKLARRM